MTKDTSKNTSKNTSKKTTAQKATVKKPSATPAPLEIVTTPKMTDKQIDTTLAKIKKAVDTIERTASKGYISIVGDVAKLKDSKAYETKGYKNIAELTAKEFGMSKGTTYNLLAIANRFCKDYQLTDEAKELSIRDMLEKIADEKKPRIEDKSKANSKPESESESEGESETASNDKPAQLKPIMKPEIIEVNDRDVDTILLEVKLLLTTHEGYDKIVIGLYK